LTQVLLNVVKNGIQELPDGGAVQVTAEATGKEAVIKVIDNGRGISQENLARIFEPFFTTKAKGTGLGLALCKKIIEEHGGAITVQSSTGTGTSVIISLPIQHNPRNRSSS
jgi:two-component system sensor histidine kinase HydH